MEIRVDGPARSRRAARGDDAHPGPRLRARRRLLPHRGASLDATRDDLAEVRVLPRPATPSRSTTSSPSPPAGRSISTAPRGVVARQRRAAGSAARRRSTRSRSAARRSAAGPVVARSTLLDLPDALRDAQTVFDATGGLHAAGLVRARRASSGCCARTSAGTTRSTSSSATRVMAGDAAARRTRCSWSRAGSASRSCRRRRSRASRDRARCRRRRASRSRPPSASGRPSSGSCATGAATSTPTPSASTIGAAVCMAWKGSAQDQVAEGDAQRTSGSASSRTGWASRSRTTTATWRRSCGRTAATCRTRGGSCARACATAARSGSPGFHDWTLSGVHLCTTRLEPAAGQHDATRSTRRCSPTSSRCARSTARSCASSAGCRTRWSAAPGRPGLHARLVGRGARPDRRRASARATPDAFALYLTARGITNEVYYVAQKMARVIGTNNVDNAARVCHAPSTTALKRDDRGRRDDVLVHRRDRQRPHRPVRRQRGERAARVHEVPVPRPQARGEGRGGQPAARARARALLGAEQRRERDVRHEDGRRVLRRCTPAATSRS